MIERAIADAAVPTLNGIDLSPESNIDAQAITNLIQQPAYIQPTLLSDLVKQPKMTESLDLLGQASPEKQGMMAARLMASQGINPIALQGMLRGLL